MSIIGQGLFLQGLGFQNVIFQLENLGFYDFILPFLLAFAIIFGVLNYINIFKDQRGLQALVALVIGFAATRFPIYSDFLAIISPKLGIGLTILLILVILMGLFIPEGAQAIMGWIMIGVAVVIALVIFGQTYSAFGGFYGGYLNTDLIGWIIIIGLLIGVIVAVVVGNSAGKGAPSRKLGAFFGDVGKALKGS